MPAAQPATVWLNEPVPCRKPTWVPSGAAGLPAVKPLPLPATPAAPANVQGVPTGRYWKPLPTAGASNPPCCRPVVAAFTCSVRACELPTKFASPL